MYTKPRVGVIWRTMTYIDSYIDSYIDIVHINKLKDLYTCVPFTLYMDPPSLGRSHHGWDEFVCHSELNVFYCMNIQSNWLQVRNLSHIIQDISYYTCANRACHTTRIKLLFKYTKLPCWLKPVRVLKLLVR